MDEFSLLPPGLAARPKTTQRTLHAIFYDADGARPQLALWAEAHGRPNTPRAPRERGRHVIRSTAAGEAHPLGLTVDAIRDALSRIIGLTAIPTMAAADITIYLPTVAGRPISPADIVRPDASAVTSPFRVSVCRLNSAEAVILLAGVNTVETAETRLGSEVEVWATACRWFLGFMLRATEDEVLDFPSPAQERDLDALGHALPPVSDAGVPYSRPGRTLVERFLSDAADGLLQWRQMVGRSVRWTWPRQWQVIARNWAGRLVSEPALQRTVIPPQWYEAATARQAALEDEEGPPRYRLTLRLEAPRIEGEGEEWVLRSMLQSVQDPTVILPSSQIPLLPPNEQAHATRCLEQEQARAGQVYPALRGAEGEAIPLTLSQVGDFLHQHAWVLQERGFAVQVPTWTQKTPTSVRLRLRIRDRAPMAAVKGEGMLGLDTLVDYQWDLALGDHLLSAEEFARLSALKVPLVRVRGEWVMLDRKSLDNALQSSRKAAGGALRLQDALRLASGWDVPEDQAPDVELLMEGRLNALRAGDTLAELEQPKNLQGELRPYQKRGFSWLVFLRDRGLGACLADDMGLGKTVQLIALLVREWEEGRATGPTLIVCPTSVIGNWRREIDRFAPHLTVLVHHGPDRLVADAFIDAARNHHVVLTTYPLTVRDAAALQGTPWDGVVLDEAQNIKNARAMQARSIRYVTSRWRVTLTGTPVENRLGDLWSLMDFLNPGLLGSQEGFHRRFGATVGRQIQSRGLNRLRQLLQPFVLRRLKTDPLVIQDLPDKLEMKVYCTLTREQATLYQALVQDMLTRVETSKGMQRRGQILTMILRLKQICDHPTLFLQDNSALSDRSGKLARLEDMLEELLETDDCALIFTQFREMGRHLTEHLSKKLNTEVLHLHGGVPQKLRDDMVLRFQSEDGPRIFVLSVKAGGVGLNLTRANHVFHYDRWWNPAVENQATDRAFRIGQTRNVQVHKFICMGTLEEAIDRLIESKMSLAENVIGSGEGWLTELSTDQLRGLLSLREDAIEDEEAINV